MSLYNQSSQSYDGDIDVTILSLLEASGAMTSIDVDHHGIISALKPQFFSILGMTPPIHAITNFFECLHPEDHTKFSQLLYRLFQDPKIRTDKIRLKHVDSKGVQNVLCHVLAIPSESFPLTVRLFLLPKSQSIDISPESLYHHKLVNLGALSAGVVHDLNNLLMAILSCIEQMDMEIDDPALGNYIELIEKNIHQASDLTEGILTFLREDDQPATPIDPISCIHELGDLIQRSMTDDVNLTITLPSESFLIMMKRTHLGQVFLNLIINARDAIHSQGSIDVTARFEPPCQPSTFVLAVADSGGGIANTDHGKIFEPFFSTKAPQQGTGLGLTIVKTIVEEANGRIILNSTPGQGALFQVFLPLVMTE